MPTTISVVVCTFNRAKTLRSALESLVILCTDDTFDYEIVVVDDGSTDETSEVVRRVEHNSPIEVTYIHQANSGVAAARNRGVHHARGEWVAFFDDDQLADRDWLLRLLQAGEAASADYVGGPYRLVLPLENQIVVARAARSLLGENPLMSDTRPRRRSIIDPRRQAIPGTGNVLVRKALFKRVGMFSDGLRCGEDLEFFMRAQRSGAIFAIAPGAIIYHIIPRARLSQEYLLGVAAKSGRSAGEIEARVAGMRRAVYVAAMRALRLFLWTFPNLALVLWRTDSSRLLSSRCAARYAMQYIAGVSDAARRLFHRQPS